MYVTIQNIHKIKWWLLNVWSGTLNQIRKKFLTNQTNPKDIGFSGEFSNNKHPLAKDSAGSSHYIHWKIIICK